MRTARSTLILSAAIAALLIVTSCATNPVTGERELMLMTESQEISMGRDMDEQIVETYGLYGDQRLQTYLDSVGQPMAAASHRPHLEWHFRVLDTPVVNAFAVPGGYVYVTRGTLAHLNSEAELAMVVGHEIGHVTARHSARAYTRQLLFTGFLIAGSIASETFRKYAPIAAIGVQVLFLKYSRDQERQSDSLGVQYAYGMGYQPREFDNFFVTLQRMKEQSGGGLSVPNFLSTHPVTAERIKDVGREAGQVVQSQPKSNLVTNHDGYLQRIDGLVFGEDPRQGFVSGNTFVHPEMGFSFNVPQNWEVQNTPRVVQMTPKSGEAFLQFSIADARSPRDAFDDISSQLDMSVIDSEARQINGRNAFIGIGRVDNEDEKYGVEIAAIRMNDTIYAFLGMTSAASFNNYRRLFENSIASFDQHSNGGARPLHVQVVRVPAQMSVDRFLAMNGVKDENREETLLINSLRMDDTIQAGRLLKVLK